MPRMAAGKGLELEMFWRTHLDGWRRSALNQREYCELHGLPLKRSGNWRAKLRNEEPASLGKRLYSRGGEHSHMSGHMLSKQIVAPPASHVPSARSTPPSGHRRFSEADKRRLVDEASRPGASVSGVAREHGIAVPLLFRWKRELAVAAEATFLPVTLTDIPEPSTEVPRSGPKPAPVVTPVVVERSTPGIEVELIGGRRVRFERDTDPETVRRLVVLLEGEVR
jgi:transposase-like protein